MIDLVYKHPDMDKVTVIENIKYRQDENEILEFDIYYPFVSLETPPKTVILVHGSSPMKNIKDIEIFQSWGKVIAASGFSAIVFNWRPDEVPSDMTELLEYIRKEHKKLKIDKDNICIFAFSARVEEGIAQAMKVNTGFIKNIVAYYGKIEPQILEYTKEGQFPSILITMGALDDVFSLDCNDEFVIRGNALGWPVETIIHSKGEHGFDAFNEDEETLEIIKKTIEFLSQ